MSTTAGKASGQEHSTWQTVATSTVSAGGVEFAYRELGPAEGRPVVFLTHLAAVLDNWDPRIVDGIAATRRVITFDNRGIGASTGKTPTTVEEMAEDAVTFIRALGLQEVDIVAFSLGGFIAQVIAQKYPTLVHRIVLAGTGPAGGAGIGKVPQLTYYDILRASIAREDPKQFLFFPRTPAGKRAGRAFVRRLEERKVNRDKEISVPSFRAQLKAIKRWAKQPASDLSVVQHPVLAVNGDHDRMVPTQNTEDLARRLPNCEVVIYPESGHGAIFQFHDDFVARTLRFFS
ncbi:alpha/beta hydrolase [Streptomyces sp. NPDC051985]|uniref:alpha/beta fold hydrolase n=1 Tax=Streptomyces sp. NPDC051985 TaxID=3155807 RepID=UPI00341E114F